MEKHNLAPLAASLAGRLQAIDYNRLPISDYNKQYIGNLKPALHYYLKIYADCLQKGIAVAQLSPTDITLVDYGGGSGFLSLLAKEAGIGQVIYIDLNPNSVQTIQLLKEETGTGPDHILHGSSDVLAAWCAENQRMPQLLIATDLIEHVYDLSPFFADLITINNRMQMLFTTASTPFNPYVKWKLHRIMKECESGTAESPNYYTLRKNYIKKNYPSLTEEEVKIWSSQTRGLNYTDIKKAIDNGILPLPDDAWNTCDPRNGNWTERILPIRAYSSLLAPWGYTVQTGKGFYNTDRKSPIAAFICKFINGMIRISGKAGLLLAPFILLSCRNREGADS